MDGPGGPESQRTKSYMEDDIGEVSDPDFWADLHYGPFRQW
jgi:hypothetical protein